MSKRTTFPRRARRLPAERRACGGRAAARGGFASGMDAWLEWWESAGRFYAGAGLTLTPTPTPTPTPNPCVFNDLSRVSAGSSKSASGSWTSGCQSVNRAGRYARFYRFSLNARADVRIDLASATDSYLFLLSGAGATGTSVESSDLGAIVDNWTYGNARYSGFRRIH